jgi:hypothetical protein
MKVIGVIARSTLSVLIAAALLQGCGGSRYSTGMPPLSQSRSFGDYGSWMLPQATSELLYVTNNGNDKVTVFSYPAGKLVKTITNSKFKVVEGECSNKAGDVYIASWENGQVFEYAHGGTTPIATKPDTNERPYGCGIDPTTGSLCVASTTNGGGSGDGDLAIYAKAGAPKTYASSRLKEYSYCAYDGSGNVFVAGQGGIKLIPRLAELPKGSHALVGISLDHPIGRIGGLGWDGKYVVLADSNSSYLYLFKIVGKKGEFQHGVRLEEASDVVAFVIDGSSVIAADHGNNNILVYKYPTGGDPTMTISSASGLDYPNGVALSAPK